MARLLVIGAHPDDETGFAGGFLAKNVAEGNDLYLLETTRGEGGEVGDPPVGPKSRLGEFREREMRCAAEALAAKELRFLNFIDPSIEIGEPPLAIDATMDEFASALAAQIAEIRPDILVTHGTNGEYGHPQHVFTHHAVREALRRLAPWFPSEVLTWCANAGENAEDRLTNQDDPATFSLDVTPWLDRKVAAAECHVSQHAMFLRNSKAASVRDMIRRFEAYRRWTREEWLAPEEPPKAGEASDDWRVPGAQK
jgi:N-acetylglucosamine malate deacetylase 2